MKNGIKIIATNRRAQASLARPSRVESRLAERMLYSRGGAHLPRQLAPAAVHTPSVAIDSLIALPSVLSWLGLAEDVACC